MFRIPAAEMMAAVKDKVPLVHHITNYVTVNDCANITICAGGSPVMTDAIEDVHEMVRLANAVVLNIGTLNSRTVDSMIVAGKEANDHGVPVVFDPVGVGATGYRTSVAERILEDVDVSVIKGNCGEIGILAGTGGAVRGVDSVSSAGDAADTATRLARQTKAVVAMTGAVDCISDGNDTVELSNGHVYLEKVSGTGCMVSSVVGCYIGANGASLESVASAISAFNVAGELAAEQARGPGSFKTKLFDCLYALDSETLAARISARKL